MKAKSKPRRKRPLPRPDALPFSERERNIFVYCDRGPQCRCTQKPECCAVDPMKVVLELAEFTSIDVDVDIKTITGKIPVPDGKLIQEITPAIRRLAEMARKLFHLQEFDGVTRQGLTIPEAMSVLFAFLAYYEEVKKKLPSSPISPVSPASASTSGSVGTKPSSGSGCTVPNPTPTSPTPSPTPSVSPSVENSAASSART